MVSIINRVLLDIFGWMVPAEILRWGLLITIFLIAGVIILIRIIYHLIRSAHTEKSKETINIDIKGSDFILEGKPYVKPYEKGENHFITKKGAKTVKLEKERDE